MVGSLSLLLPLPAAIFGACFVGGGHASILSSLCFARNTETEGSALVGLEEDAHKSLRCKDLTNVPSRSRSVPTFAGTRDGDSRICLFFAGHSLCSAGCGSSQGKRKRLFGRMQLRILSQRSFTANEVCQGIAAGATADVNLLCSFQARSPSLHLKARKWIKTMVWCTKAP